MKKNEKAVNSNMIKEDASQRFISLTGYILVTLYALACIFPFILIIGTSFSSEDIIRMEGVKLIPAGWTTFAYSLVIKGGAIWGSYLVTIIMTSVGTVCGLFIIAMTGYALQRKDFPFRNGISFYIYFTSLFSAGLAPYYLLMTQTYHLKDNYLAVLLPLMMSPWLIILMKNFAKAIPHEITESGKLDGAGDMSVFLHLVLPLMKPGLATIGLFLALGYWNEWYQSSLFLSARVQYKPLQYNLYEVVNKIQNLKNSVASQYVDLSDLPTITLKMATAVLSTGPIILVYPFIQKYFIGGITIGAVKG